MAWPWLCALWDSMSAIWTPRSGLQGNAHVLRINAVTFWTSFPIKFAFFFWYYILFFSCGATAQRGPVPPHAWGFKIAHNYTPQSVGLLWTRDRPVAETCTKQRITLTRGRHLRPPHDFFLFSEFCFLFFVCTFSVLVSLSRVSWLVPLSLLYNTHPCFRRDSNPQSQQAREFLGICTIILGVCPRQKSLRNTDIDYTS